MIGTVNDFQLTRQYFSLYHRLTNNNYLSQKRYKIRQIGDISQNLATLSWMGLYPDRARALEQEQRHSVSPMKKCDKKVTKTISKPRNRSRQSRNQPIEQTLQGMRSSLAEELPGLVLICRLSFHSFLCLR